jgi:hypothetical protein
MEFTLGAVELGPLVTDVLDALRPVIERAGRHGDHRPAAGGWSRWPTPTASARSSPTSWATR